MDIDMGALRALEREREISLPVLLDAIRSALHAAYLHTDHPVRDSEVLIDERTGEVAVIARERDADGVVLEEWDDTPENFGRVAASTARQVIFQRIRDLEDDAVLGTYADREDDIVSGIIQQGRDPRMVLVDLGEVEAVLPPHERVPGEDYSHGRRLRAYVTEARRGPKGPQIMLSRSHPNFVRRLFALEVPEVADGTVEIAGLAREAGHRTKMAVRATVPGVNAKGACIGPMGARVRSVMNELGGEKIDIVDFDEDPAAYVAGALSPSKVSSVTVIDEVGRAVRAVVPENQLSLAIGKDGRAAIATTAGNPDCHVILRGGAQPNFDAASVSAAAGVLKAQGRRAALMIDASHANSGKNPDNQPAVIDDIAGQIERGDRRIVGTMIESHLVAGKQALVPGAPLVYGQSITDGCIDWTTTERVLDRLAIAVRARRARVDARAA